MREPLLLSFSAPVITHTVGISINPQVPFTVTWDSEGRTATLTLSGLLPLETYQLAVLGGEGLEAGSRVLPMECDFTTDKAYLFLPLVLDAAAMPEAMLQPQALRLDLILKCYRGK